MDFILFFSKSYVLIDQFEAVYQDVTLGVISVWLANGRYQKDVDLPQLSSASRLQKLLWLSVNRLLTLFLALKSPSDATYH